MDLALFSAAWLKAERDPLALTAEDFRAIKEFDPALEPLAEDRQHAAQVALVRKSTAAPSPMPNIGGRQTFEKMGATVRVAIATACHPLAARLATLEQENETLKNRVLELEVANAAREKVGP
jgi:hypothetical protein